MKHLFKKVDNIFLLFLFLNIIIYIVYHRLISIRLLAEDIWNNESIYSDSIKNYKEGDIIIVHFNENLKFNIQIDQNSDKKLTIKLIPDKILFDYLPDIQDDRSSQKGIKRSNKDQIMFNSKIPLKIVQTNNNNLILEGSRQITFNNANYVIFFRGETNSQFIKNNYVDSNYILNLSIQIQIVEESNQNLQLENEKIQITDETKRKIFIEYLKKILEEQNINVP